jgi:transcriptional regulator with XRE-family HTH domain
MPLQTIENPRVIGEHIKKRRLELKLLQSEVAKILDVCEDTMTGWENSRSRPLVYHYPKIIQFLGYNPFPSDTSTLGGRIKQYRTEKGITQEALGRLLLVNESTIFHWEKNIHLPSPTKLKSLENLLKQ